MDAFEEDSGKKMNRRDFLAWAAAAAAMVALPGCTPQEAYAPPPRSRRNAYASAIPPNAGEEYLYVPGQYNDSYDDYGIEQPQYVYVQPQQQYRVIPAPQPAPRQVRSGGAKVSAMSRNSWGAGAANPGKMKAMNGVNKITVHHEGSKPNNDTSVAAVTANLRLIQSQHRQRMGAGDIGYHFIIDRTGIIWQGRDWKYQGAHTSGANSNNLGVMLLGNFESQQPTARQLDSLTQLTASLIRKYGLSPRSDIYGHNDFCNTKCPGKNLKSYVVAMRKGLQV